MANNPWDKLKGTQTGFTNTGTLEKIRPKTLREQAKAQAGLSTGLTEHEVDRASFEQIIQEVAPLIEQVNALMKQYASGLESKPPAERRKHLQRLMTRLYALKKVTPTQRFKAASIQAHYQSYNDRWDRILRDIESGKIQRPLKKSRP